MSKELIPELGREEERKEGQRKVKLNHIASEKQELFNFSSELC